MAKAKQGEMASSAPMYQFDALTGFWGIPNAQRMTDFDIKGGPVVKLAHNSCGNRDIEFVSGSRQRNFLCCGGSHSWGAYVTDGERYSNILRNESGLNFMNVAHPSLGLDQICLSVTENSQQYHPEGVIVEQYPWAFHRVLNTFVNGYVKPYFYIDKAGELRLCRINSLAKNGLYRNIVGSYRLIKKELAEYKNDIDIKSAYDPLTDPVFLPWKQKYYDYGYELFGRIAKRMSDYCDGRGIKFIIFLTAHQQQFSAVNKSDLIDYHLPVKRLRFILNKYNVPFVEFTEQLLKEHSSGKAVIMPDGHLNAYGHAVVARELKGELSKRKWF